VGRRDRQQTIAAAAHGAMGVVAAIGHCFGKSGNSSLKDFIGSLERQLDER